jgi:hypothetical protein
MAQGAPIQLFTGSGSSVVVHSLIVHRCLFSAPD